MSGNNLTIVLVIISRWTRRRRRSRQFIVDDATLSQRVYGVRGHHHHLQHRIGNWLGPFPS